MLDVSVSYNRYKFLGHEFLTWLWYMIETDPNRFKTCDPDFQSLAMGNRIVLENNRNDSREVITIKGDDPDLEEGVLSLKKGGLVTEMHLIFKAGENAWRFNLKGESLGFSSLKVPETGIVETGDDIEGAVLEKAYLLEKITGFINKCYLMFLNLRLSEQWTATVVPDMKKWIRQ